MFLSEDFPVTVKVKQFPHMRSTKYVCVCVCIHPSIISAFKTPKIEFNPEYSYKTGTLQD